MNLAAENRIAELCSQFRLPTLGAQLQVRLEQADQSKAIATVVEVLEMEAEDRQHRRVQRLLTASKLSPGKTLDLFDQTRLPAALRTQIERLTAGKFLADATNVLCFGLPGTGKTTSNSSFSMTSDTCSSPLRRSRCSSPCWPSATSGSRMCEEIAAAQHASNSCYCRGRRARLVWIG